MCLFALVIGVYVVLSGAKGGALHDGVLHNDRRLLLVGCLPARHVAAAVRHR